jgi:hypothetical protein
MAPVCAFATPQGALNSLPPVISGSVTINVEPGTYYTGHSATPAMTIAFLGQGSLTIARDGSTGSVVISGATSATPGTAVATWGVNIPQPSALSVTLQNLSFTTFTNGGLLVNAAMVALDNVSVTETGGSGLFCNSFSTCTIYGSCSFSNNASDGVFAAQANLQTAVGSTLSVSSNGGDGVGVGFVGQLNTLGNLIASGNGGDGLHVQNASTAQLGGSTTISIDVGNYGVLVERTSFLTVSGPLSVTVGANLTGAGVGSTASSSVIFAGSSPVTLTQSTSTGFGFYASVSGSLQVLTSGTVTITGFAQGIAVDVAATFYDNAAGTRSQPVVHVGRGSVYVHGGFPQLANASGTCLTAFCY